MRISGTVSQRFSGWWSRISGVVAVLDAGDAEVESRGHGEGLEGGAELVGAQRGTVEEGLCRAAIRRLGIERREADQGQQLAGLHVHHHAGGAERAMGGHGVLERLGESVLDPDVERERKRAAVRLGAPPQLRVGRLFDAGETAIVHVREPDRVGEEAPLRIDALLLAFQPEAGDAEPVDGVRLLWREVVPQQGGLLAGGDERGRARRVEIGEQATERSHGLLAIEDLAGLDVEGMRGQVRRQEDPVAVHDVGPSGGVEGARISSGADVDGCADHRHVEGANHQRTEAEQEDRAGHQQAATGALQQRRLRLRCRAFTAGGRSAAPPAPGREVSHSFLSPPMGVMNVEAPDGRWGSQRTCAGATGSSGR